MAASADESVVHPLIPQGAIARRDYQVAIALQALKRNTLVILPTGMGKTVVALLVIADRLQQKPGKVLLLAPTKPLVEQHAKFFSENLLDANVTAFTGETSPEERDYLWRKATVVCSTPQVIQNDVVAGRFDLKDVTLLLFDEAHRAVGNYAYVFLADAYRRQRKDALVLALTASPGAKAEKVAEICENLGIEGVEVRTEFDADTAPYVQDTDVEWKQVSVPASLQRVASLLKEVFEEKVAQLRVVGGLPPHVRFATKKALLDAQLVISARIKNGEGDNGALYKALSAQAAALKVGHALELVETQGVGAIVSYLERLIADESKAAKSLREDPRLLEVGRLLAESRVDHPKIRQVAILVRQQLKAKPDARIIVFTNYRDTSEMLVEQLKGVEGVRPARFVGQASRSETDLGMSQKRQVKTVEDFKQGVFNVLVATSVAEEGLDIPQTDLVVFYEPVPSEIRAIQRRGRTGRRRSGRVVILITKDTRDEASHWASRGKEQKMRKEIDTLKAYFKTVNASEASTEWKTAFTQGRPPSEKPLTAFQPQDVKSETPRITIITDHREFNSSVVRELSKANVIVKPETLVVGDYVLSDRVAVERKAAEDFASSLIDGRLFQQVRALRDAYSAAIVIIEGDG
ncbi:MAG: helicase-related protein, partial [Candidatus Thermoplasmatota archaeon]